MSKQIPPAHGVRKIVAGGQTGVDRGALDAAIELGIPHGGWCPRGRTAEDGTIDARYQLRETTSPDYASRTERNVVDSDASLIVYRAALLGGTALTERLARRHNRPCMAIDLDDAAAQEPQQLDAVRRWIAQHAIEVLNVAGPRESQQPGIATAAKEFLLRLLK